HSQSTFQEQRGRDLSMLLVRIQNTTIGQCFISDPESRTTRLALSSSSFRMTLRLSPSFWCLLLVMELAECRSSLLRAQIFMNYALASG
ncbi:hypothetical protein CEXT_718111, partial [Caerostris extrusa]